MKPFDPRPVGWFTLHVNRDQLNEINRQKSLYGEVVIRITADGKFEVIERSKGLFLPGFDGGSQLAGKASGNGKAS